jgi:hypothetical protein
MKKLIITATAASMLAFGAVVSAEQQLSFGEMDGVTAGGFVDAFADARARGVTSDTYTSTYALTRTIDAWQVPGQVGVIDVVASDGEAVSSATATGSFAQAGGRLVNPDGSLTDELGYARGNTVGTLNSDVTVRSFADADTTGDPEFVPGSRVSAYSFNMSQGSASEIVIGRTALSNSQTSSVAVIGN